MGIYQPASLGIKPPKGGFQTGGWYNGRQYWNGTLSEPNQIHPESNQQGAGQEVSKEVVAVSNPAQGLAPGTNEAYLAAEKAKAAANPVAPATPAPAPSPAPVPAAPAPTPTGGQEATLPAGNMATSQPTIDVQSVYDQAFKAPEIGVANTEVSDIQAEIDALEEAYNNAKAIINDNPMYGATTMSGKEAKLRAKFSDDKNLLQNKKAIAQDNLAKLKADAEIKVNLALKQYDINNQAYKDKLSLFNTLLDAGALTNASGTDIATYAAATGIPTNMIQGIIDKQKKSEEIKPQIITSTDDSGTMFAVAIDPKTGSILYKTSLGKIDKATKQAAGSTKDAELQANVSSLIGDISNGVSLRDLVTHYGSLAGLPTETVYNYYNQYSPNGPAKETMENVKAGVFKDLRGYKPPPSDNE